MGLHVLGDWDSPVMPIMVYHLCFLSAVSRLCYQRHVAMVVVGFPATALLLSRCRVCISASHTREDLDYALDVIEDVTRMTGMHYDAAQIKRRQALKQKGAKRRVDGLPPLLRANSLIKAKAG